MGGACNGSCLVLQPHGTRIRPVGAIDTEDSGKAAPFIAWLVSALLPPKHNHISNVVWSWYGLGLVHDSFTNTS